MQGSIISAIGSGIIAIISAIAGVLETIVSAIVGVRFRSVCRISVGAYACLPCTSRSSSRFSMLSRTSSVAAAAPGEEVDIGHAEGDMALAADGDSDRAALGMAQPARPARRIECCNHWFNC